MNTRATAQPRTPHLFGALVACSVTVAILCAGRLLATHLERKTIQATAPRDFFIKNQGLAFQRTAARDPRILLVYGSSELIDPVPNRASDFFSSAPTGFQVCPIGKGGTTSLITLQKLGALGADLRQRKIAILVSPSSFFLRPTARSNSYAANFSLEAASGVIFGNSNDWRLKTEIAARMAQFPGTLAKSRLLQLGVSCLASHRPADRVVLAAIWPLGKLQNAVFDLQDHFEALVYILAGGRSVPAELRIFSSHKTQARKSPIASDVGKQIMPSEYGGGNSAARDARFRKQLAGATEWSDLELLFRVLAELQIQPLILGMPVDPTVKSVRGVSRGGRQAFYDRMRELSDRYHFRLIQFEEHDGDPNFLITHREHPTPAGWMFYNRALDDFFHNRNRSAKNQS